MRRALTVLLSMLPAAALAQSLQFHGFLTARGIRANAPESWTTGGAGKFDIGGDQTRSLDVAQLGVDWTPTTWLTFHADGLARNGVAAGNGRRFGLVQAYVEVFSERWRLRAGQFWMGTSRENVDPLWNSRYTITYSALNSWIGEEARPTGADLQFSPNFYVTMGATAFRGDETMGTLLAARGWSLGNRLTVLNETIPTGEATTRPFSSDLNSKTGFSERLRIQLPERALLLATHVDNNAELYPGKPPEVPWRTRFDILGTTIGLTSPTTFAAEWMWGSTTVAFPHGTFRLHMNTVYALLSHKAGAERLTARVERFTTRQQHGHATTLSWLHDMSAHARGGVEYVRASAKNGGSTVTLELRYSF